VRSGREFPAAGNFLSGAGAFADLCSVAIGLRSAVGKFPDANRDVFEAEQGISGGWQGMLWELSVNADTDTLMLPPSHNRRNWPCDCGNFAGGVSYGHARARSILGSPAHLTIRRFISVIYVNFKIETGALKNFQIRVEMIPRPLKAL
jgi:hypothetical protein